MEIFLATKNKDKIKEIETVLKNMNIKIFSLNDYPEFPATKEDGKTYKENAVKKAFEGLRYTKKICLADDSGLEIEYLDGKPGIYSSRWGETDKNKINKVLTFLEGVPKNRRCAKFVCVLALIIPNGKLHIIREKCDGEISFKPKGNDGFGYDPIFLIPKHNKTFAELGSKIKNQISHRGKALKKVRKILEVISSKS